MLTINDSLSGLRWIRLLEGKDSDPLSLPQKKGHQSLYLTTIV